MPVLFNQEKVFLYIHVPKTGGSFVEIFFNKNGYKLGYLDRGLATPNLNKYRRCSPQHMEAALLRQTFRLEKFDGIFMTVRHPVKRIISEYRMRLDPEEPEHFNDWFGKIFEEYQEDPYVSDNHIRPQHEFVIEGCAIFRQEDKFDAGWAAKVESLFGIKFNKVFSGVAESSHKKAPYASHASDISAENKEKILKLYKKDFETFGYEPSFD